MFTLIDLGAFSDAMSEAIYTLRCSLNSNADLDDDQREIIIVKYIEECIVTATARVKERLWDKFQP